MAGCQAINKMTAKFYSRKIYNFILFSYDLFFAVMGVHCCLGFSLIVASGGYSSLQSEGFSLHWLLLFPSTGSRACRLQ